MNMIEDVGEVTVLAGASTLTGTRHGEPVAQASESDPPEVDDLAGKSRPIDDRASG